MESRLYTKVLLPAVVTTLVTWHLTRKLERDVFDVRRRRITSEKEGKVWAGDDIHVFENQVSYTRGLHNQGWDLCETIG